MKIPNSKELGGMLREYNATLTSDIELSKDNGDTWRTMVCNTQVYTKCDILKLLKAIGLPEPDFTAEPLSVEEWEKNKVDGYVTLDFEQQTISADESAIFIGGLPLSEWKKKLGIEEPNTDEQE
jgi:hypothetical protein